jgi:hypothetical protein
VQHRGPHRSQESDGREIADRPRQGGGLGRENRRKRAELGDQFP